MESGSNYVVEVLQLVDCDAYLLFGTAMLLYSVAWLRGVFSIYVVEVLFLSMFLKCFGGFAHRENFSHVYVTSCST